MKISSWITINNRGSCKLTKGKPRLDHNEVCMKLNIEIPNSVFQRPLLQANIKIDGELNYEFDYNEQKKIEDVIETLPNVHLLKIDIVDKDATKE